MFPIVRLVSFSKQKYIFLFTALEEMELDLPYDAEYDPTQPVVVPTEELLVCPLLIWPQPCLYYRDQKTLLVR